MTAAVPQAEYSREMLAAFRQFGSYANVTRALPDVRDGLKPVHRRILWAMWSNTTVRNGGKVKAAKAVGDTMGDYHPHGDAAIYSTMVGMAQPFNLNVPLIDGRGNWGSLEDPPAAYRYTECLLQRAATALLGVHPDATGTTTEIDENGVELVPNYTGTTTEPLVLPALWPAYVVNGSEGIGVGVAGKSAPHNLGEVMELAIYMVDQPNVRTQTVLSRILGPDIPSGCDIFNTDDNGIERYITEGIGSFVMRARWTIETYDLDEGGRRTRNPRQGTRIHVTALPYRVSADTVVAGIRTMVEQETLPPGIVVTNVSSDDVLLTIDVGVQDVDNVIQRLLYHSKTSRMQETFPVYMNAVVGDHIETTSVVDALHHWIAHRRQVVRRRSQFRLERAQARMHLVDGFLRAVPLAAEIVKVVQATGNRAEAAAALQSRWQFSEVQANAILDLTIVRLTRMGVDQYLDEKNKLQGIIDDCTELLNDQSALNSRLKSEMRAVSRRYSVPRRCRLIEGTARVERPTTPAVEIPAVPGYLAVTGRGWVRWTQKENINKQLVGDHVVRMTRLTDQNMMDVVTDLGYHYRLPMDRVPKNLVNAKTLFGDKMDPGEEIVMIDSAARLPGDVDIVLVTKLGKIKRIPFASWVSHRENRYTRILNRDEGDLVAAAFMVSLDGGASSDIAILTGYGRILRLSLDDVPQRGDGAAGVAGIRLDGDGDAVVWAGSVTDETWLTYWTSEEQVGQFKLDGVGVNGRAGKGRTFTLSQYLVTGVTPNDLAGVAWFGPSMDEPGAVDLGPQKVGLDLSDRQLTLRAPGIGRAAAVWPVDSF